MMNIRINLIGLLAVMMATPAMAQLSQDPDAPIDITGETFEAFEGRDMAIWTGDVQVVQAEAVLTAPKLSIFGIANGNINRIEASGGIRYTNGVESISGDKATYREEDGTIIVTGNVVVVQDNQVMSGERLIYHIDNGELRFSASDSGRVRGIFYTNGQTGGADS